MTPPSSTRIGPALPATAAAGHGAGAARLRRGPATPAQRRRSGPAPRRRPGTAAAVAVPMPFAVRLGNTAMRVGDARFLDRLVRGRAWIAIVAVLLLGIVFMQVSLLKLNAGISRAVATADTLDRQNSALRAGISELDSNERIQGVAASRGMILPAPGDVHFLDARGIDAARAANAIKPPSPVVSSAAATTTAGAATATAISAPGASSATDTATGAATTTATPAPAPVAAAGTATTPTSTPTPATTAPAAAAPPVPATTGAPATTAGGATAPQGQG
jgi:cell division protein FtsL